MIIHFKNCRRILSLGLGMAAGARLTSVDDQSIAVLPQRMTH